MRTIVALCLFSSLLLVAQNQHRPEGLTGNAGIEYHGGPVMAEPLKVYLLFYGTGWTANDQAIITDFITGLGASAYLRINQTYYSDFDNGVRIPASSSATLAAWYWERGTTPDADPWKELTDAINWGRFPPDPNGLYYFLGAPEVTAFPFCTAACGWHGAINVVGTHLKTAFVGNPLAQCPVSCSRVNSVTAPNGSPGVDAMVSIIAHELMESVTDPDGNGWYRGRRHLESGDLCAWNFGPVFWTTDGTKYNIELGARRFLIQQDWVNSGNGHCGMWQ